MYRKNVAGQNLAFCLVNASTGAALAGATVTAKRSIDGGAQASVTGTISDLTNGQYNLALSQADTNGNQIGILLTATGAVPVHFSLVTTAADPTDTVRFGLTALPNAAAGATGGLDSTVALGGTASAGTATTITLTGGSATDNLYNHEVVQIVAGTGAGQARTIVGYVGSTKVATVSRSWTTTPDNTSVFQVKGLETTPTWQLMAGTLSAATATTATLTGGVATDSYYNGALLVITAGTGQRQARTITGYVGGTTVATLDRAWATTPDSTSVYVVYGADAPKLDSSLQVTSASVQGNVTGSVASVTGAVGSVTGNVAGSVNSVVQSPLLGAGTATAGTANTITLQTALGADNVISGATIAITGGTGLGETRAVLSYVNSTRVVTVDRPFPVTPDSTSVYVVWGALAPPTRLLNTGMAQAGAASTITLAAAASATDNLYNECAVQIVGGTGVGQLRAITGYVGATKIATVDRAWSTNPDSTSLYVVSLDNLAATNGSGAVSTVATVTNGVIVTTNNDKTGYGLANNAVDAAQFTQAAADKVWTSATRTLTAFAQGFADQVWTTAARTLTAFGFSVTVGTNNDKSGYSLSGPGIQAVWDALTANLTTVGSVGKRIADNLDSTISGIPTAVWAAGTRTLTAFSFAVDILQTAADKVWGSTSRTLTAFAQGFSDQVWASVSRTLTAFGFSVTVGANNDKTGYGLAANAVDAAQFTQAAADKVWASVARTLTAFGFSVTVGTNGDKTGYSLSAGGVQAIWDALTANLTTVGSVGKRISDNLDATVSGVAAAVWAVGSRTLTAFSFAVDVLQSAADKVWNTAARTLTAFGFGVTVSTNNDKTGYGLSPAAVQSVWDALTSALTTVGSIGKLLVTNIDALISSRLSSSAYTAPPSAAAIDTQLTGAHGAGAWNGGGGGGTAVIVSNPSKAGQTLTIHRGDHAALVVTGLGTIASRTKLWFTVKTANSDTDAEAIIQIEETGGLLTLNGAPATAGHGSITVTDANVGNLTVDVKGVETALLVLSNTLQYDFQMLTDGEPVTLATGVLTVSADVTRAIS